MTRPRIGSLCSGTGALDMAVMDVYGGSVAWHCQYEPPDKHGREDKHQYAARILAHHWPDVPNHGDLTAVDWAEVEPVDILTAGFPCTDLSYAGLGAGIKEGTRSGLWLTIARAVRVLQPRLLVLENVRAIVNRRPGLDVVLSSLAELGFHAVWVCVRASDVGAPHERWRWFCLAWPADSASAGLEGPRLRGWTPGDSGATADADCLGYERDRTAGQPAERLIAGTGRSIADPAVVRCGEPAGETVAITGGGQAWPESGGRSGLAAPDAQGDGRESRRPEPAGQLRGSDAAVSGEPTIADAESERHGDAGAPSVGGVRAAALPSPAWGAYGPAIARWERTLGRPAPRPVDDRGRLVPELVEWMMGLPEGHICSVPAPPGMSEAGLRNARLKAGGNGVVVQQGAYAIRLLDARMRAAIALPSPGVAVPSGTPDLNLHGSAASAEQISALVYARPAKSGPVVNFSPGGLND